MIYKPNVKSATKGEFFCPPLALGSSLVNPLKIGNPFRAAQSKEDQLHQMRPGWVMDYFWGGLQEKGNSYVVHTRAPNRVKLAVADTTKNFSIF